MFPIEIVNKILVYVSEINNNIIITQYNPLTHKEYYKINYNADILWKIKSTLIMKRYYPVYPIYTSYFINMNFIELYKHGIPHYENKLRLKMIT